MLKYSAALMLINVFLKFPKVLYSYIYLVYYVCRFFQGTLQFPKLLYFVGGRLHHFGYLQFSSRDCFVFILL